MNFGRQIISHLGKYCVAGRSEPSGNREYSSKFVGHSLSLRLRLAVSMRQSCTCLFVCMCDKLVGYNQIQSSIFELHLPSTGALIKALQCNLIVQQRSETSCPSGCEKTIKELLAQIMQSYANLKQILESPIRTTIPCDQLTNLLQRRIDSQRSTRLLSLANPAAQSLHQHAIVVCTLRCNVATAGLKKDYI